MCFVLFDRKEGEYSLILSVVIVPSWSTLIWHGLVGQPNFNGGIRNMRMAVLATIGTKEYVRTRECVLETARIV